MFEAYESHLGALRCLVSKGSHIRHQNHVSESMKYFSVAKDLSLLTVSNNVTERLYGASDKRP